MSATEGLDALYRTYEESMRTYTVSRIASLSLWGAGLLSFGVSLILPGRKSPAVPTLADKLLVSAGVLFLSGGTVTSSLAGNYLLAADDARDAYTRAVSNFDSRYEAYAAAISKYRLTTFLSYGLWGAGTAAILTSLIVPFRAREAVQPNNDKPVGLSILPYGRGGLTVSVEGRLP